MLADTVTPISWLLVYTILSSMIGEGNLMRLSDDEISRQIGSRTRALSRWDTRQWRHFLTHCMARSSAR